MRLLTLLLAALPALAQTAPAIPSPHQLRDQFERTTQPIWTGVMRQLGLPTGFSAIGPSPDPILCEPRAPCNAETIPLGFLNPHFVTVLKICGVLQCRIIFFAEESQQRWHILGYLDEENDWGLTVAAQPPFILINGRNRAGSGVWANHDDWFEITASGLRRALRTLKQGHDVDAKPARYFRGAFLDYRKRDGGEVIDYIYRLACEDYATELELFDERRLVRFVRPTGSHEFKLDARRSELSEKEIDTFYFYDTEFTSSEFLSFARTSLLRLARTGNNDQKRWLANYLAGTPASAVKSELLRALAPKAGK